MENEIEGPGCLFFIAGYAYIAVFMALLSGVLYLLYNWFALPLGAPELSAAHLLGLWLVYWVLTSKRPKQADWEHEAREKNPNRYAWKVLGDNVLFDAQMLGIALIAGAILHLVVGGR